MLVYIVSADLLEARFWLTSVLPTSIQSSQTGFDASSSDYNGATPNDPYLWHKTWPL
jgi:hypothetical protein